MWETQIAGHMYGCEMCNKYFLEKVKPINHQRVHTWEKPFECEIYNKLFSHKEGHNKHIYILERSVVNVTVAVNISQKKAI